MTTKQYNMSLEPCTFDLLFYTSDGNLYTELGQTLDTMNKTITYYKKNYKLSDVEMFKKDEKQQITIPLLFYNPF